MLQVKDHFNFMKRKNGNKIQILKELSFSIPEGTSVGIVGESGSGKSSVWKVLFRLFELKEGVIKIGDVDISLLDREELRKRIAVVPQEVEVLRENLQYNIGFGGQAEGTHQDFPTLQEVGRKSKLFDKLRERHNMSNFTIKRKEQSSSDMTIEEVDIDDEESPLWKFKLGSNSKKISPGEVTLLGVARALMKSEALVYVFDDMHVDVNYL